MNPTNEFYNSMETAYEHFNQPLFDGELPSILFTTQRQKGVMGYFSPDRWASAAGKTCHEIAINPAYVGRSALIELLQTLVHEMTHCWQHCFGKPSRAGYHNKEWAEKMESIGLMPSNTGEPGGKKVGQSMNDYPIADGLFIQQCVKLVTSKKFNLPWVDRFAQTSNTADSIITLDDLGVDDDSAIRLTTQVSELFDEDSFVVSSEGPKGKTKSRYTCSECQVNVWGKPDLNLNCGDCNNVFIEST